MTYMLTATVLSAAAIAFYGLSSTYSISGLLVLGGVAVSGLLAQLAMTLAFSHGSPTLAATLQYSTIGFAAAYSYLVLDETLGLSALVGIALLAISGGIAASLMPAVPLSSGDSVTARAGSGDGSRSHHAHTAVR